VDWRLLCEETFQPAELEEFKSAILNSYFFEMFVEDLPMWGYVGDVSGEDLLVGDGTHVYLFPHLHFRFGYNGDHVVSARAITDVSSNDSSVNLPDQILQLDRRVDITDTLR